MICGLPGLIFPFHPSLLSRGGKKEKETYEKREKGTKLIKKKKKRFVVVVTDSFRAHAHLIKLLIGIRRYNKPANIRFAKKERERKEETQARRQFPPGCSRACFIPGDNYLRPRRKEKEELRRNTCRERGLVRVPSLRTVVTRSNF